MTDEYAEIEIRIRPKDKKTGAYPVEVRQDDGSFDTGKLRIDKEDLLRAKLEPMVYGVTLFHALFSGEIGAAYANVTGRAEVKTDGRVRVRLWIDDGAAELHAYIWERLRHRPAGQFVPLTTYAQNPFSRFTGLPGAEPDPIV